MGARLQTIAAKPAVKKIALRINRVPLSLNERERLHWSERRKANRKWRRDIMAALGKDQFCIVQIRIHRRRLLDEDNAQASIKPVLDGLRDSGLIFDDSRKWIVLRTEQVQDNEDYTEIEIQEVH